MATCYFESDIKHGYPCEYKVTEEKIYVNVDYFIEDEIESVNGVKVWSAASNFKNRDILIVDGEEKKSLLIKDASYLGFNNRMGSLDDKYVTSFGSYEWFESSDSKCLLSLDDLPMVSSFKIYSDCISEYLRHPSVSIEKNKDELVIRMSKKRKSQKTLINSNNIKSIILADDWKEIPMALSYKIAMFGYLEIVLDSEVPYNEVYKYLYELMIYLQLYYPGKFKISKVRLNINTNEYDFVSKAVRPIKYTDRNISYSINGSLLDFLKNCYIKIPYRDIEGDVRNIPYVIMNSYRSIEDNFLMFYRFIEFRYKRKKHYDKQEEYIKDAFYEHYKKDIISEELIESHSKEIVCLRNHYAHEGYYIHNSILPIRYNRANSENNYEVVADFKWIYEKTKLLYVMVVDIIFTEMLGYSEYNFQKVF